MDDFNTDRNFSFSSAEPVPSTGPLQIKASGSGDENGNFSVTQCLIKRLAVVGAFRSSLALRNGNVVPSRSRRNSWVDRNKRH